jgi:predicted transcriptional regulator
MHVSEVMHKGIVSATSVDSVRKVAKLMKQEDIGAIPIIEKGKAVGFVTDRDIVVKCIASGQSLDGPVSQVMSHKVISINQDQEVEEASRLMQQNKVSRILVTDKDNHAVGMIGLQNLAKKDISEVADTLYKIKQ